MDFNDVKYSARRKKGEFEWDECSISASLNEQDDVETCLNLVKGNVYSWLDKQVVATKATKVESKTEVAAPVEETEKKVKATRNTKTRTKTEKVEEPKVEEPKAEEVESEATIDSVRDAIQEVYKKNGKAIAAEVLKKFGYTKITEVKPEDFANVIAEAKKALN